MVAANPPPSEPVTEACSLCEGDACEEGCGKRTGCRSNVGGPDDHRVCTRCGGSGRPPVWQIPEGCNELCRRQAAALLLGPLRPSTHTCVHGHAFTLADVFPRGG